MILKLKNKKMIINHFQTTIIKNIEDSNQKIFKSTIKKQTVKNKINNNKLFKNLKI